MGVERDEKPDNPGLVHRLGHGAVLAAVVLVDVLFDRADQRVDELVDGAHQHVRLDHHNHRVFVVGFEVLGHRDELRGTDLHTDRRFMVVVVAECVSQ